VVNSFSPRRKRTRAVAMEPIAIRMADCCREAGVRLTTTTAPSGEQYFNSVSIFSIAGRGGRTRSVVAPAAQPPNRGMKPARQRGYSGEGARAGVGSWRALSFSHENVREARWFHSVLASRDKLLFLQKPEEQARALWASWNASDAYRIMARGGEGAVRRTSVIGTTAEETTTMTPTLNNRKDGGEANTTAAEQGDSEAATSLSAWVGYLWHLPQASLLQPASHSPLTAKEGEDHKGGSSPAQKLLAQMGGEIIDGGSIIDRERRSSEVARHGNESSLLWELLVERLIIDGEGDSPTNEGQRGIELVVNR